MGFADLYLNAVEDALSAIVSDEREAIDRAGELLASSLSHDGMLYVFGCGHSHMVEEELFYRAGGLAPVCPMFDTSTMLHEGAAKSSLLERKSGYAPLIAERYPIGPDDCLLVASTSGINSLAIEMAQAAAEKGAAVIGISSFAYREKPSRHPLGLHLPDVCDVCVDNHVAVGDASVPVRTDGTKAGPTSSIATLLIANLVMLSACERLRASGREPEVFLSGNCEGSSEHNADLVKRYSARVRSL